jgi:hypothetical protein
VTVTITYPQCPDGLERGIRDGYGDSLRFLNDTQPDEMAKLHKFYGDKTEKTVINYINREVMKASRSSGCV